MNNINFDQTGGFPLETDSLSFLQATFGIFNALGAIAGDAVIVSGCVENGSNVGNGTVYLNGELLEFRGGSKTSTVKVFESVVSKEFENGDINPVFTTRWVGFGSGVGAVNWSDFVRVSSLKALGIEVGEKAPNSSITAINDRLAELEKQNAVFVEAGAMVFWNKPANQIPEGWREVVDWRGRMPVGFDPNQTEFNSIGKTGGSKSANASVTIPISSYGTNGGDSGGSPSGRLLVSSGQNEQGEYLESIRKASSGPNASTTVNVLNPYRTVLFIEYVRTEE
ncbi:MAG: hypothetical protein ABGW88_13640 [Leeuwenhoekiella sp.]|uniref:hypothetical protein n=1 Tax=Leeuwenhoekiella sp. TaxID=1977054 RepID=UPI003242D181